MTQRHAQPVAADDELAPTRGATAPIASRLEHSAEVAAATLDAAAGIPRTCNVRVLCIDRLGLARMLGISERQVSRLCDAGKLPQALSLGGCKRWSIEEIEAWVRAGCPRRAQWENLRSVSSPDRPHGAGH